MLYAVRIVMEKTYILIFRQVSISTCNVVCVCLSVRVCKTVVSSLQHNGGCFISVYLFVHQKSCANTMLFIANFYSVSVVVFTSLINEKLNTGGKRIKFYSDVELRNSNIFVAGTQEILIII